MIPKICLVMMVKDEARGIRETLESVRDHVDYVLIVDTGSEDRTKQIAIDALEGKVSFGIRCEDFVDFASSRNRAIDAAPQGPEWWHLMLSGDAIVENGQKLREVLELVEDRHVAVALQKRNGEIESPDPMLTRAVGGPRYVGATHEALEVMAGTCFCAADAGYGDIVVRYPEADPDRQRARWLADERVLRQQHRTNALAGVCSRDCARTEFYLAQTLSCLGDNGTHAGRAQLVEAVTLYQRCAARADTWDEQRYVALYRAAKILGALGSAPIDVVTALRHASNICRWRAEAPTFLARFFSEMGAFHDALVAAEFAASLPIPRGGLCLEPAVYEWQAREWHGTCLFRTGNIAGALDVFRALFTVPTITKAQLARIQLNIESLEGVLARAQLDQPQQTPLAETDAAAASTVARALNGSSAVHGIGTSTVVAT